MIGENLNELALFAGAGGGLLGSRLLGWGTQCAVEIDSYCREVLLTRQRDGVLPRFPIWDDVRTFDGNPWRGAIDVVSGGFPCQDISSAGKGEGIAGDRSSLFFEMLRIVKEVQPAFVFTENSPDLRTRGLAVVVEGLTSLGYVGAYGVLGAGDVGAPHKRKRMWIVACHSHRHSKPDLPLDDEASGVQKHVADTNEERRGGESRRGEKPTRGRQSQNEGWWATEPDVGRVVDGLAARVDDRRPRIKALGNGQVPLVAATAWRILAPLALEMANR